MAQEFEKSAGVLSKAVELDENDPVLKINLAMTYANLRNYQEAFKVMEATFNMDFDSKNASALINLGYLYKNMGKQEKAQECFKKAQKLNPELFNK